MLNKGRLYLISYLDIENCANQTIAGNIAPLKMGTGRLCLPISIWINVTIIRAGDGAQQHMKKEGLNNVKIFFPPNRFIKKFVTFIFPIFRLNSCISFNDLNLRKKRDLLLRKLKSGELINLLYIGYQKLARKCELYTY